MKSGLIGRKLGMGEVFVEDKCVPVTVIEVPKHKIVSVKTVESDGYEAVQVGAFEGKGKHVGKALQGVFSKAGLDVPVTVLKEFVGQDGDVVGSEFGVERLSDVKAVTVRARSKGKGFQGVMKRHGFGGGRATHGSKFHREMGSTGMCQDPGRVIKGSKFPGHMGDKMVSVKGLSVVEVIASEGILLVKGSVPGAANSLIEIYPQA